MKSNCAVAIFVKTPGISPIKTRLAENIGQGAAEKFHELSAQATEELLLLCKAALHPDHELKILWAIAEKEGMEHALWKNQSRLLQPSGSLGERLGGIYQKLRADHDAVIFLGADSPQIQAEWLMSAADHLANSEGYVVGPAADGGFYLFGSRQEIAPELWTQIPYSQSHTLNELIRVLAPLECTQFYPVLSDVDTFQDFCALRLSLLRDEATLLPAQRKLLSFIEEILKARTRMSVF